ncbi:MAG: Flp family type IVb pilin [Reyranella sp.]|uniref:Flp family type IVb pilin n=1 Tax=Reyranella sp. TaxID=1929291 RepID=UPI000A4F157D|nr:Flp family type IVb pilin [Reyranella sp.]MBR2817325.1 Flp family type IVb pilin [Reyranella sp.]
MLRILTRLARNERGATTVEYTLIASLIAVAAIVAMSHVGKQIEPPRSTAAPSSVSSSS